VSNVADIERLFAATVDDVANVAECLASDLAGFVSGQHLLVTGGAPA
jgi:3-oxoacyl-[acyl-carrier protein] reductase